MEEILKKLLVPDNEVIKLGTAELKEAFKSPNAIPELCQILVSSQVVQVRQYCAVLLKKKFAKSKIWFKLSVGERCAIKEGLLNALINEPEKSVKQSIAQVVGVLSVHELPKGSWPQLTDFFSLYLQGDKLPFGLYTLSIISDLAASEFKPFLANFGPILNKAISDRTNIETGFYAIKCLSNFTMFIGTEELNVYQPIIANVINYIKDVIIVDEEKANESMEIFDELFETEVPIVVPHTKPIVELCLMIAPNEQLEESIRNKAISFMGRLMRLKKKTVIKHKLYIPMINVLFPIICGMEDMEDGEDDDLSSPAVCASQTLDVLAVNLPPQKFMPALLQHVEPSLSAGNDPKKLVGSFTAIGVISEGCSEHIRSKYLGSFLTSVGNGISNPDQSVRNSAYYALGQLSEYLQPEISNYSNDIFPVLFDVLDTNINAVLNQKSKELKGLDRVFYALEIFCENLAKKLIPVLPDLMKRLLTMLSGEGFSDRTRELSISAIAACANAVKAEIVPYFNDVMGPLKQHLVYKENDDAQVLLTQSMYTCGVLARAVGPTSFGLPMAEECVKLGLQLVDQHDDPDIRKCAFSLFAAVSFVVKEDFNSILPQVADLTMKSMTSNQGISFEYKDEEPLFDALDDDVDEDEISIGTEDTDNDAVENVKAVKVENSYMEEKEQAILALKEICEHVGEAFNVYLPTVTNEVYELLEYPDEDIRKAAAEAMPEFAYAQYKLGSTEIIVKLVPKLCTMISEDEEVGVVCACLQSIETLLKKCQGAVINCGENHAEAIIKCVKNVMNQSNINCIDCTASDFLGGDQEDEDEAEQDQLLFEYAGDVLPYLGKSMTPQQFLPYFKGLFPMFVKKTKKYCNDAEKSFAVGSLAECMDPMAGLLDEFIPTLLQVFMTCINDEDEDVRNNAVYGMGEMCAHGGNSTFSLFPQILASMSDLMGKESAPRVIDQIVGAVCRLIIANHEIVPVNDVAPVIIKNLPLKEDQDEYETVFKCLLGLYSTGSPAIVQNLPQLLETTTMIDADEVADISRIQPLVVEFVKNVARDLPQEFQKALSTINAQNAEKIMAMVA